ncbi:hypothetical protein BO70DRAFT_396404 [Aspergillus heteromorphus CBS 117.55]|uniref:Uncharacterized protein n=1 Tax=Aspergillus heteromorphus CBS 117.55 TaxID=1448321 RepID=A0A317W7Q1_9EURO|nr:uncharacterized protein BO70DRAFT_396404 [Aspergillus heteromorphus CBS 117.55]PWY82109.1 hypothetical protein BO70DRAFT_396404 [Aspergillus heteromorphus CBS 117.55]
MASLAAGVEVAKTVTAVATLGFVPVAIHFHPFDILAKFGGPVSAEQVATACREDRARAREAEVDVPCPRLIGKIWATLSQGIG